MTSCSLAGILLIVIGVLGLAAKGPATDSIAPLTLGTLALALGAGEIVWYRIARRRVR